MKRGSIEISFGMIFSIIIIIVILGVGFYAITAFLNLGENTEIASFHQKFKETVDNIWSSASTNRVVAFTISNSIEAVCFGSLNGNTRTYSEELSSLLDSSSGFQQQSTNMFLYPPEKAEDFAYKKAEKIDTSSLGSFDCFDVKSGKVKIRFVKEEFDSLVKIQHE